MAFFAFMAFMAFLAFLAFFAFIGFSWGSNKNKMLKGRKIYAKKQSRT